MGSGHPTLRPCDPSVRTVSSRFRRGLVVSLPGPAVPPRDSLLAAIPPEVSADHAPFTEPGAEGVAIDADDSGDRAAVRIEGRRRIVGLDLDHQMLPVVEGHDAGVVVKDRDEPRLAFTLDRPALDLTGGSLEVAPEQRLDGFGLRAGLAIVDRGIEDLVLAVLAPGLGQALELDVGGCRPEPQLAPARVSKVPRTRFTEAMLKLRRK